MVGIDEAQFFDDGIVEVANQLANNGIRVVIAGLDMDFLRKTFRADASSNGDRRIRDKSARDL